MLNYRDKVANISEQLKLWKCISKILATALLVLAIALIPLKLLMFNQLIFIGLLVFAITSVAWWIWAIINIKFLLTALLNTADNIDLVNNEFIVIKSEINEIKLDHVSIIVPTIHQHM